ncbi:cytidylate kinase-like family protein [Anaerobium acetethylicum]|uniref:Cytidylate kinase n=1 Tax=Anaerobium acetethylicum TaxID=1619234 RepID=A0A1D3TQS5_9FIRM|nr:cytidylate kinase-like family protein [Anaerobium acetethylicum]SCP95997.1 Cytidylate kinase [Anaerobium acetethylicum]
MAKPLCLLGERGIDMKRTIITIARQYGCGGSEIGKRLAEEFGIDFYDREILKIVADESGVKESYFHLADEKVASSLLYKIVSGLTPKSAAPLSEGGPLGDENLFKIQSEVIRNLAEKSSFVIVGRLAEYVLKDRSNVVSVYLHADEEFRIRRMSEINAMDETETVKLLKKRDRERAEYCRHYTGRNWGDANYYTLAIDTGRVGINQTVEIIRKLAESMEADG